ncbi:MAG: pyridoxal-phosphate dependent enzyme, partial [Myxococcota bacterium]
MTATTIDRLECGKCGAVHDPRVPQRTCTVCGGPLLARYPALDTPPTLAEVLARPPGQERLHELSPLGGEGRSLGEGATPLVAAPRLSDALDIPGLLLKDESQNPTASFKSRGMAAAIGRAHVLGIEAVCLPSAGNAGGAAA